MATPTPVRRYGPTTGSFTGWLGLVLAAVAAVAAPVSSPDTTGFLITAIAAAGGLLVWMVMLRPRVLVIAPESLELRNVISSWFVPLTAITDIEVRAVTRVRTADGRYDGVGVGRTIREMRRSRRGPHVPSADSTGQEADLMIGQVLQAVERARADGLVDRPVRRVWAVPELGVLAVLVVAAAVLAVL